MRSLYHNHLSALAFAILVLINVGLYFSYVAEVLSSSYQIDWGEGTLLAVSHYMDKGIWLLDIYHEPYICLPYPPLMPLVVSLLGDSPESMLLMGRAIAIVACLSCSVLLYLVCRKLDVDKRLSLVVALFPFFLTVVRTWSVLYRVDIVGVAFCLLGVYLFLRWEDKSWKWLWAAVPIVAGLWTKQSLFIAGLSILIYLVWKGRYRDAVIWMGVCTVLASIPAVIGVAIHGSEFVGTFTWMIWAPVGIFCSVLVVRNIFLISIGLLILVELGFMKTWRRKGWGLLAIWLVISLVLSSVLCGKVGASTNYFIEPLIVACPFIAAAWIYNPGRTVRIIIVMAIAFQGLMAIRIPHAYQGIEFPQPGAEVAQSDILERIENDEWVLSDDISLSVFSEKEPPFDLSLFAVLSLEGRLDETQMLEDLNSQRFDHIVTFYNPYTYEYPPGDTKIFRKWTVPMQQAIVDNYEVEVDYFGAKPDTYAYRYCLLRPTDRI